MDLNGNNLKLRICDVCNTDWEGFVCMEHGLGWNLNGARHESDNGLELDNAT